ncbi:unnamed protein product, partial [Rotaria magnacalcarata]
MDSSINFHCEPPPSNSGLKKRPAPIIRTRIKPSTVDLDDSVPLEGSHIARNVNAISNEQAASNNPSNNDCNVTFRPIQPVSSNRKNTLAHLAKENSNNGSNLLNPSDKTLFYLPSAVFDDDSVTNSNSYSSFEQVLLPKHEENNLSISNVHEQNSQSRSNCEINNRFLLGQMDKRSNSASNLLEQFSNTSLHDDDDDNDGDNDSILP